MSRVDTNVPLAGSSGAGSYDRYRDDRTLKSNVDVAEESAGENERGMHVRERKLFLDLQKLGCTGDLVGGVRLRIPLPNAR